MCKQFETPQSSFSNFYQGLYVLFRVLPQAQHF